MAYERVNWENLPSTNTPVNADNLNKMDEGIANAVEQIENAVEQIENYSTNETKVGSWIDNKPIYKKTIIIRNKAFSNGDNTIAHGISNFKQYIKAELKKDGGHIFPYFNYNPNNTTLSQTFIAFVDSTNITIRLMNDSWGNHNVWYVTIYYTKTTD